MNARSLLRNWTPEIEEAWRKDPAGVWQTLEEEFRHKRDRGPRDQLTEWVSRSVGPLGFRG